MSKRDPWYYRPPKSLVTAMAVTMALWMTGLIVWVLTLSPWAFGICLLAVAWGIGRPAFALHLLARDDARYDKEN
ncbi:hypothetical protein [Oerskovia enterophila]|uniref:hypothetical protein n=1 Tax=Oerskovia enterophila TaxID=43678 RepID=UPI003801DB3D